MLSHYALRAAWLVSLFAMVFSGSALAKQEPSETQPYPPSYLTVQSDKPHASLSPDDWTDARICGQCHSRAYKGWEGSMHSHAFKDPVFQALWALAEKDETVDVRNHCGGCHSAVGTITNTIEFDPSLGEHGGFTAPTVAAQGVSCDVCHTISATNLQNTAVLEHGNTSFEITPGDTKRASLKDAVSPYHKTEYSELHAKSDFCGNCHNIFNPVTNYPVERTYDEWKYSIYAQKGIQCQDCHMVPVDAAIEVADTLKRPGELKNSDLSGYAALGGPYRKVVHDHRFVGGNYVITAALDGTGTDNDNYQDSLKRLQTAASLELKVKPGKEGHYKLKVKVNNDRAGHNLPTSLTEVREVWLEVVVKDDKGRELLRSGTLDENNEMPKESVRFGAHAVDIDGNDTLLPWKIAYFTEFNTIPPKGYKYGRYGFALPQDAEKVTVTARLHYRSFSQGLADMLLGDAAPTVPAVEMAKVERVYTIAELHTDYQKKEKKKEKKQDKVAKLETPTTTDKKQ